MSTVRVIVIQTMSDAAQFAREALIANGLVEKRDFVVSDGDGHYQFPEDEIVSGRPQLLVTGTFNGNGLAANRFVAKMKERNPNLQAWFYGSMMIYLQENNFDRMLSEPNFTGFGPERAAALAEEVVKFLNQ